MGNLSTPGGGERVEVSAGPLGVGVLPYGVVVMAWRYYCCQAIAMSGPRRHPPPSGRLPAPAAPAAGVFQTGRDPRRATGSQIAQSPSDSAPGAGARQWLPGRA